MKNNRYLSLLIMVLLSLFTISGFCSYERFTHPAKSELESVNRRMTDVFKVSSEISSKENYSQRSLCQSLLFILPTDEPEENDANSGGDAGDTIAFATEIAPDNYNGTINSEPEEKDYYRFSVQKGVIINITMIALNSSSNFDLSLYSPEMTVIKQDLKEAGIREMIIWSTTTAGNYYALIAPASVGQQGGYNFSLSLTPQNDFDTGEDAGNTFAEPLNIIAQGNATGLLVYGSDSLDFYQVSLNRGEIITIFLESTNTSNIDLFFYAPNGEILLESTRLVGFNETILWAISDTGDYSIGVELVEVTSFDYFIPYNLSLTIITQNDANSGTDAGGAPEDATPIYPLTNSRFRGQLMKNGDTVDFYVFERKMNSTIYLSLEIPQDVNFDVTIYNSEKIEVASSKNVLEGAKETIFGEILANGTYYLSVEFISGEGESGEYLLNIGLFIINTGTPTSSNKDNQYRLTIILTATIGSIIIILIILIVVLYLFTSVRIPWLSDKLDKYLSKEGRAETMRSLKYALRIRDNTIEKLREDMIDKDAKRAKDLETIHRLEEHLKSNEKVLSKIREENEEMKRRLGNLEAVNDDLANIIDSTIKRQLTKSSATSQKAKVAIITSHLWLSEERLRNYITSIPLLSERYILDRSKNHILPREYAREIVRQAYWKRVGAMHLKKIKQVKVASLSDDTNIDIETLKEILRELVERKEIPAPIHMDRMSLLLSISEEIIAEMAEISQTTPVISLKEISKSYDITIETARIIFERIAEEGYAKGEFINADKFVVMNLFANAIAMEGSMRLSAIGEKYKLEEEEVRILIEKLLQTKELDGLFLTDELLLCFNNLPNQFKDLIKKAVTDLQKGDTRRMVFDIGSIVESIVKKQLILKIAEVEEAEKLTKYQEVIESKELGRILRAAEDEKVTLPANVELKSINRFWATKIKHTKPGELPYIPNIDESLEFLFEANRALNRLFLQELPTEWKILIAENLLKQ